MSIRRGLTTITVLLALTGLLATPVLAGGATSGSQPSVFYLSLGTSLSVGIQPNFAGHNRRTQEGYADQLYAALGQTTPQLRLVKLGCPGETSVTMIYGGLCDYEQGAQLAQAGRVLHDHQGAGGLVTIGMGANDGGPCGGLRGGAQALCIFPAFSKASGQVP